MRLFGDGYWWEFEAEAEKEGKQKVGEGVKIFIEKVRIFAEKLGWDESKIKRTVLLGVREEFRYDQGMGNRGEVFMTWEGFEPGTWCLELWDLKQFKLRTLELIMWMMMSAREHHGWTLWEMEERGRMGQKKGVLGKREFIVLCCLY